MHNPAACRSPTCSAAWAPGAALHTSGCFVPGTARPTGTTATAIQAPWAQTSNGTAIRHASSVGGPPPGLLARGARAVRHADHRLLPHHLLALRFAPAAARPNVGGVGHQGGAARDRAQLQLVPHARKLAGHAQCSARFATGIPCRTCYSSFVFACYTTSSPGPLCFRITAIMGEILVPSTTAPSGATRPPSPRCPPARALRRTSPQDQVCGRLVQGRGAGLGMRQCRFVGPSKRVLTLRCGGLPSGDYRGRHFDELLPTPAWSLWEHRE